jgi:hypothetical protein
MRDNFNPKVNVGDKVILYYMEGETGVPPGTLGTVTSITRDPFESANDLLIKVKWENGSGLSMISSTDKWKLAPKDNIKEESRSPEYDFFTKNSELFDNFNYKFFKKYLLKLRDSGVINMFQAEPFLYSGREWIDRYYGENQEDNDEFQEVLEMADESKDKMIQGLINYMESKNMDFEDLDKFNNLMRKFAIKINQFYIVFA